MSNLIEYTKSFGHYTDKAKDYQHYIELSKEERKALNKKWKKKTAEFKARLKKGKLSEEDAREYLDHNKNVGKAIAGATGAVAVGIPGSMAMIADGWIGPGVVAIPTSIGSAVFSPIGKGIGYLHGKRKLKRYGNIIPKKKEK